jgi:putative phosphoribosyl transferase
MPEHSAGPPGDESGIRPEVVQAIFSALAGIATGSMARAACQIARAQGAARVVLAVPVAPPGWQARIGADAGGLACVDTPRGFFAIGQFYAEFPQVSDEDVMACLDRAAAPQSPAQASTACAAGPADPPARSEEVEPRAGVVRLAGYLAVPENPRGIVVFAHGSGSSRHSPRNRYVAGVLNDAGLGTLLFDLLTPEEELDPGQRVRHRPARPAPGRGHRMAARPAACGTGRCRLLRCQHRRRGGAVGGGRARRWRRGRGVPRRPDLARPRLAAVTAPALLIVGGHDEVVLDLNRRAQAELRCENDLAVVPGATHLFEEPGTLAAAAGLARDWFLSHLTP